MQQRYFIAEGPEAERIAKEGMELVNKESKDMEAVLAQFEADTAWLNRSGIVNLAWKASEDGKPVDKLGFKYAGYEWAGNTKYHLYKPDLRTKEGKDAKKIIAAFKRFSFSDFACKAFSVSAWVAGSDPRSRTGLSMFCSAAGYCKGTLCFMIPFNDPTAEGEDHGHKAPKIPDCFREIKKSEWISLTEE